MRVAALAFGVLAGLVASLILALGGLDPAALPQLDSRQMSLISFGLFVVANFGVFGAGIVLAAPLAGAILMLLGAIGWIAAALVLHHGPDFVMLTPPCLLLAGAILAVVAFLRRPRHAAAPGEPEHADDADDDEARFEHERELALQAAPVEPEHDDEPADTPSSVAVGATFFGNAGTATPLQGAIAQVMSSVRPPGRDAANPSPELDPIRRRSDPPRQKSVFVEPEDEFEDEESGLARFARGFSGVLSFGLYAALAAAAVLIFWTFRTGETAKPTATRIEASAGAAKPAAPALGASSAASSSAPTKVAEAPAASSLPPLLAPPVAPLLGGEPAPSSTFGREASAAERDLSSQLGAPVLGAATEAVPSPVLADPFAAASSAPAVTTASSAEPEPAEPLQTASASAPLPFAMPPQMAVARTRPAPRATPPAPAATTDTGL